MKKRCMISVVAIVLAAAFAVSAAEKNTAVQKLVLVKVDGKTVAELRVFDTGAFSMTGDQCVFDVETGTRTAMGATLQFGGASGKSITVKAEEMEVSPLNKEDSSEIELQPKEPVVLKADRITYDAQSRRIVLEGNAKLESGTGTLTGDKIVIAQAQGGSIAISGNVKIMTDKGTIKGSAVTFKPREETK